MLILKLEVWLNIELYLYFIINLAHSNRCLSAMEPDWGQMWCLFLLLLSTVGVTAINILPSDVTSDVIGNTSSLSHLSSAASASSAQTEKEERVSYRPEQSTVSLETTIPGGFRKNPSWLMTQQMERNKKTALLFLLAALQGLSVRMEDCSKQPVTS